MDEAAVRQAANELRGEITSKVGQLTDRITGRSPDWVGLASQDRDRWPELSRWYLTAIRIAHRAELDPTGWALNARRFGATWEAIGEACGVTRQAAYDRWGKYSKYEGNEAGKVSNLNAEARAALRSAGISEAGWARRHFGTDQWVGDACGCPDDRCIGYHHDKIEECGCLPVLLDEVRQ